MDYNECIMVKKQTTIDDLSATIENLAIMVKREFDDMTSQMAAKEDLMATREDIREYIKEIWEELDVIHADVRYVRNTMSGLVSSDAAQDTVIQDLTIRTRRLEKKVGLMR